MLDHRLGRSRPRQVDRDREPAPAPFLDLAHRRVDGSGQLQRRGIGRASGAGDVDAGIREREGEGTADAAARTGDQRDFAGEIEGRGSHDAVSSGRRTWMRGRHLP